MSRSVAAELAPWPPILGECCSAQVCRCATPPKVGGMGGAFSSEPPFWRFARRCELWYTRPATDPNWGGEQTYLRPVTKPC